ncbi:MAG: hypothetical protein E6053_08705 [Finegoldia magna]|uniref:hypothetical protein n=1 Tax=Finegoldia magna TaxID=1260 RepID=UPI00291450EB|nr:hypothetical protein [Finegoldia magna]MDU5527530.1 hypothetical protein [Finegoldia magna]
MKLYELYWCDEWRNTRTLTVSSRIVITKDLETIADVCSQAVKSDEELFSLYGDVSDKFDLFDRLVNQEIEYLHFNEIELDEINL